LRFAKSAALSGSVLFGSSDIPRSFSYVVRPVVSLGSNVKISAIGGTADSPRELSL